MKRNIIKFMRKLTALTLAIGIMLSLVGCANSANNEVGEPEVTTTEATTTEATTTEATTTEATTTEATTTEATTTEATTTEATTTEVTTVATTTTEITTTTAATTTEASLRVDPASGYLYATSSVNVRKGPGTGYERVGHLDKGDRVEITGVAENGWFRIKFKGSEHYVSGSYLSNEKPAEVTTVQTTVATTVQQETTSLMSEFKAEITCPNEYLKKKSTVTYGKMVKTSYYSTTCEKNRNVIVLLPAGYDKNKEYPVMYVLHGIFGDETSMIGDGNSGTRILLGNLMNKDEAADMIVVFPYMYASKTRDQCTAIDLENVEAYDNFINDLVNDLMPFMSKNYAVAEGKENTAIIGFSMGGREALAIGFTRPDLFGYVGAIAPAPGLTPGRDWAMEHPGQFKESELKFDDESPYFLMICSGDNDHTVGTFPRSYHHILTQNEVEHIWYEIPGSDHGDPAISSGIYNFAKTIFK